MTGKKTVLGHINLRVIGLLDAHVVCQLKHGVADKAI